ncbi:MULTISPECIES: DoxX family protein [unclassified Streptomyces]|uniref:DoxX family protein n=1 Tax=unclassified Streptomyces TaxID=2593676 RepID=UPI001BE825DF|nr:MULTISPECIES: DoxX family membrane protein [unclassified Streptomyces]MBT2406201.1 DoxX family membrane protein [Streptomyces sp. ISL-21]MBT2459014.1 DoxX family membrane protein [Streptomyces sp. ISL-86]MBT2609501.1 DoxX family membrane protein [Streptomyces sp. ISL-87]
MPLAHRKDLGLLALRLGAGGVLIAHGSQKLFGWFGGGGIDGTAKGMEHMGFTPGRQSAIAAGLGEAGGGALLALGLATPAAGAAAAGAMAGAVSVHAPAGFFAQSGGFEYPAFLGYVAAGLGLAGPGRYSLDHLTRHKLDRPAVVVLAFTLSAALATVVVKRRNEAVATAAGPDEAPEAAGA